MAERIAPTGRSSFPERVGRYRIINRIGHGAMGVVYAAQDENIGRPVALKVLIADLESDPDTRARFYREAQAAARLLHRNIITIFDAGEAQGRSFIAMQLLEGAALAEYLQKPEAAALEGKLDLMIQVCEGLAAAHGEGIIHRDLKPSNLFVQSDGLLKILDFGVARIADSIMTAAGTMLGTPEYMSPEQARGEQVDVRSDVFSAGAVFYFMLAGRKPFVGPDLPSVLRQLQFDEPAPLGANVPPELSSIVLQAMAKSPDGRPARIEDMLALLVRFRRQYQAETRRLVLTTRTQFDAAETLTTAVAESGLGLDLPPDDGAVIALRRIQGTFPPLANRRAGVEVTPVERARVVNVLQELEDLRRQMSAELEMRRGYMAQLEAGQRALASGDARSAVQQFEAVARACPHSRRALELAASARPLAQEQDAREERIAVRTAAARRALDARDWPTAVFECQQALALAPAHRLASSLLAEAEHAIAREQRRISLVVEQLLQQAVRSIKAKEFDAAEAALREADSVQPASSAVADLRQQLSEARAVAEEVELVHQMSVDEIRRARSAFRRGRYDEAVQQLRGFLEVEPNANEVAGELQHLIGLREALTSAATVSHRTAVELVAGATSAAQSGAMLDAVTLLRQALRADPTDADAATLLDQLMARQLEERLAQERAAALAQRSDDAKPLLVAARHALERGYVALGLKAALAAQRVAPNSSHAAALVEEARGELMADDRDGFQLAASPFPEPVAVISSAAPAPAPLPSPKDATRLFDWAADRLRGGLRRGKA